MSATEYGVNHPLAVKLWSRKLMREALKETYFSRFMGSDSDSLIQSKNETSKGAGDKITFGLRMQLTGAGVQGDATLEGNEESLVTYSDAVTINQLRHAVLSQGKMSEQRVPFDIRAEAMAGLKDWLADRFDTSFFNHIAGNSGQADTRYTGNVTAVAPSGADSAGVTRQVFGSGAQLSEGSLSTTDAMQLTYLDQAVLQAKTAVPLIRPVRSEGKDYWVVFLHPKQVKTMRTDATANRVTWFDTQKTMLQGGTKSENTSGIFTGALGVYNQCIIHEALRLPSPAANIYRGVLCGAQAAVMAFGQNDSEQGNWVEKLFDYDNQLGVKAGAIFGLKKTIFNSIDFGTVVISTKES